MENTTPYKTHLTYINPCESLLNIYSRCTAQQDASRRTNYNCEKERLEYIECEKLQKRNENIENWKIFKENKYYFFESLDNQRKTFIIDDIDKNSPTS